MFFAKATELYFYFGLLCLTAVELFVDCVMAMIVMAMIVMAMIVMVMAMSVMVMAMIVMVKAMIVMAMHGATF